MRGVRGKQPENLLLHSSDTHLMSENALLGEGNSVFVGLISGLGVLVFGFCIYGRFVRKDGGGYVLLLATYLSIAG